MGHDVGVQLMIPHFENFRFRLPAVHAQAGQDARHDFGGGPRGGLPRLFRRAPIPAPPLCQRPLPGGRRRRGRPEMAIRERLVHVSTVAKQGAAFNGNDPGKQWILIACHISFRLKTAFAMTTGIRIKDLPKNERPRERLAELGAEALRHAELIAILLRTGMKGFSAIQIAEQLLHQFKSLDALSRASLEELKSVKGVGQDKAIALKAAFTLARLLARESQGESPLLDNPERIADYLREDNRAYKVEQFQAVLLNTRRKLIRVELISQGLVDTILIHPREVFRLAIAANASALVLVHNHPSGDPTPSEADIRATRDLIRAGQLLKIEVLDHIILGRRTAENGRDYASLRELGFFNA